jgi:PAS domain S-box-containing protein
MISNRIFFLSFLPFSLSHFDSSNKQATKQKTILIQLLPIAMSQAQSITMPIFAPAGNTNNRQQHQNSDAGAGGGGDVSDWQEHLVDHSDHDMDFDLLAECLFEDNLGVPSSSGIAFDFGLVLLLFLFSNYLWGRHHFFAQFFSRPSFISINVLSATSGTGSSVVSPEQSVDGGIDSGSGAAQARQIITQHANSTSNNNVHIKPQPQMVYASAAAAAAPGAQLPIPQFAAHGINVPTPIPQYVVSQPQAAAAPAAPTGGVLIAPTGGISGLTIAQQQPGMVVTKRRRTDQPGSTGGPMAPIIADPAAVAAALQGRGRKKTQAQIDRRRERNRILARRTRLRKKFFFESLQKEVMDLQRENAALKEIVRSQLDGEEGRLLLEQCDANEKLPEAVLEACGELSADMDKQDFNLIKSIQSSQHSFVITDPSLQDNPIVFASDDFLSLTGYSKEDVLGRNCRFLQGSETSTEKVDEIRKGLASGDDVSVTLVNYTADGVPFWNKLFIAALRDSQNNIVNFIGVIVKVASPEPGDPEFGKIIADDFEDGNDDDMDDVDIEDAVKAIEGAVDAAVAAAPSMLDG